MRPAKPITPQSAVLTEDKAWLLGHVAGDGCVRTKKTEMRVGIWAGLDEQIAEHCLDLFASVYGVPSTFNRHEPGISGRKHLNFEIVCYRKAVVDDMTSIAPFGVRRWRVPRAVMEGSARVKGAWLSGLFDADGTVGMYGQEADEPRKNRVASVASINDHGLRQVEQLLTGFGIRSKWRMWQYPAKNPNSRDRYNLFIYDRESLILFSQYIRFRSVKKQTRLDEILVSYRDDRTGNYGRHKGKLSDVLAMKAEGRSLAEIAEALDFDNQQGVQQFLQRAARRGEIGRFDRTTKIRDAIPTVIAMRKDGKKWKEIGRVLGHMGTDHESAVYAVGVVGWARKKGLWPEDLTRKKGVNAARVPKIAAMRAQGMKLAEIGRALGLGRPKDNDQWIATLVSNIICWAKKKGLWPEGVS